MELKIDFSRLNDILLSFYKMSGIKIIIFDENREIIASYPPRDCNFCRKLKENADMSKKCLKNDTEIFNKCKKSGELIIYTCHAGLVEGCAPIKQNGKILGYIMFGQISDLPSREVLSDNVYHFCRENGLDEKTFIAASRSIKLKKYDDIMAAAKIFEACISYIVLNEMMMPKDDKTMIECERFIDENIADVTVEKLCSHMNISRTALYGIFREKSGIGVSSFIRNKQLEHSKKLLTKTNFSVSEIASMCGFSDYNYFSRVFKKKYGASPKAVKLG